MTNAVSKGFEKVKDVYSLLENSPRNFSACKFAWYHGESESIWFLELQIFYTQLNPWV